MCSLASLLFLRFGLLPIFNPGPPSPRKQQKKKRTEEKTKSKLCTLLRRAMHGGTGGGGKVAPAPEQKKQQPNGSTNRKPSCRISREHSEPLLTLQWSLDGPEGGGPRSAQHLGPSETQSEEENGGPMHHRTTATEETATQQQQQRPRKWKKSFKICKCVPPPYGAADTEEIKLPSTVVDSKPRALIMSTNSGSRFRIIPVENRYKRGRWQVWDYYEGAELKKGIFVPEQTSPRPTAEVVSPQSSENTPPAIAPPPLMPRRNSFQLVTIRGLDDRRFSSSVPASISEEKLNSLGTEQQPSAPPPPAGDERTPPPPRIVVEPESARIDERPAAHIGPAVPQTARTVSPSRMIQQFGLERSLTLGLAPNEQQNGHNRNSMSPPSPPQQFSASFGSGQIQFGQQQQANGGRLMSPEERRPAASEGMRRSSSAVPSSSSAQQQQRADAIVAIDSKIGQAMDLVKTHLIYAVRDEIESLRTRIVHLETMVVHLEAENAVLREHIPRDVLANLCLLEPLPHKPLANFASAALAQ